MQPVGDADAVPAAHRVLERLHGDDRRRSGVERRPAFKPPESEERRGDDADDGGAVDHDVPRHHAAGARLPRHAERQETVVSQIARGVFGGRGWPYYAVQAATMLILVLAANTAYADFPRLASILARDRLPAAAVHEPGRPARVLERHRRAERVRGGCCWSSSAATRTR